MSHPTRVSAPRAEIPADFPHPQRLGGRDLYLAVLGHPAPSTFARWLTTRRKLTGMYELLDALRAVIASGEPSLRQSLIEVFAAYEEDFPEEFAWATGAQAPTLLSNLMLFCQPLNG